MYMTKIIIVFHNESCKTKLYVEGEKGEVSKASSRFNFDIERNIKGVKI